MLSTLTFAALASCPIFMFLFLDSVLGYVVYDGRHRNAKEGVKQIYFLKYLSILTLLLVSVASAEMQPCVVCSVEQNRLHDEECEIMETFEGQKFYFCKDGCRDVFLQQAEKWRDDLQALKESSTEPAGEKAGVGDPLPEFRFPLEPIGSVSKEDLKDKVLLLNFWATWCAPCKAEMPALVKLQQEKSGQGLVVLGLSFDKTKEAHQKGVKDLELNFPSVYADQAEVQKFLQKLEPVEAIPVTIVVDGKGKIVERLEGEGDLEKFRSLIAPYLDSGKESSQKEWSSSSVVPS